MKSDRTVYRIADSRPECVSDRTFVPMTGRDNGAFVNKCSYREVTPCLDHSSNTFYLIKYVLAKQQGYFMVDISDLPFRVRVY